MLTSRTSVAAFAALSLLVGGCPKKGPIHTEIDEGQSTNPVYMFGKAGEAVVAQNWDEAYQYYAKVADELNGGPKAEFNAGYAAEQLGKADLAEGHYRDAFTANPDYEAARYSLIRVLKSEGKATDAADVYGKYLEKHPDDDKARAEYMDALVAAGRYDEAVSLGQEVLRTKPDSDGVYRALSAMYLRKGMLEMAQITGDKALELNDKDPDVYNNMGVVYLQQGDIPGAIAKFKMARTLDSAHYEANLNLGLIAADSGDYVLAQDCFLKALERNPSSIDARVGKAVAMRGLGDIAGAQKIYDDLIKENPKLQIAYFNAATLHEVYTKDFAKSLKYLEAYKNARAGELSPNDEVFLRIQKVEAAQLAEEERKRLEAQKKKEEEERKRRAKEMLDQMVASVDAMKKAMEANVTCFPEEVTAELGMFVESAQEAITAQDTEMAADFKQMLDEYYKPMLDGAVAGCAAAPEQAPPPDGTNPEGTPPPEGAIPGETPPPGDESAPAEAPPAETPAPQ